LQKKEYEPVDSDRADLKQKEWFLIMKIEDRILYEILDELGESWRSMSYEQQREIYNERLHQWEECKRQRQWEDLCPPIYRDTDPARLPNRVKFDEVQAWAYGPKGLILMGRTRRGKTRAAWKLLERLHKANRRIAAFSPMDLKRAVAWAWQDGNDTYEFVSRLHYSDVLFFDDLDTIKFTESVEETIYDAFEYRSAYGKPVIVTCNQSGDELARRLNSSGRGAKIVERMREFCDVVNFD
jgi:hypothetical protein